MLFSDFLVFSKGDPRCYAILVKHFALAHEEDQRAGALFEATRAAISKDDGVFLEQFLTLAKDDVKVTSQAVAYCARSGGYDTMKVLLAHGGSVNAMETGQHEVPAVVLAAALGNAPCLAAFFEAETEEKIDLESFSFGLTCLMHAAKEGHLECVRLILKQGAMVDACRAENDRTALFYACTSGHYKVVQMLLEHGADPCRKDRGGLTGLHNASQNRIVELLLRHGADPNAVDNQLHTPLFRACLISDYLSMIHLLRFGADPIFAHQCHLQRVKDMEEGKTEMETYVGKVEDVEKIDMTGKRINVA